MRLILASQSPRRREFLTSLGVRFDLVPSGADESLPGGVDPAAAAREVALRKARDVAAYNPACAVLAADTVVALAGVTFGKPADDGDARRMLALLSGREHEVHTGVALAWPGGERALAVTTRVVFADLGRREIDWYIATGEGRDKAGAYGIQGLAGAFVKEIHGSYSNVVGLPLAETLAMLEGLGLAPWGGHE